MWEYNDKQGFDMLSKSKQGQINNDTFSMEIQYKIDGLIQHPEIPSWSENSGRVTSDKTSRGPPEAARASQKVFLGTNHFRMIQFEVRIRFYQH